MLACRPQPLLVVACVTLFTCLAVACLADPRATSTDPVVRTEYGAVRGKLDASGTVQAFLGVPFAAPPVGDGRFATPGPPLAWAPTILNTTAFGPSCLQHGPSWLTQDESCLYLNIWAPNPLPKEKLPVMLWIYGGCFVEGSTAFSSYDGTNAVVRSNSSMIIVSANYRVGVFGFAGSAQLRAVSGDNSTGNLGLQDQRAAMQFVRSNIEFFGGDRDRVTLWGESAGGVSVSNHMVAKKSFHLFQRAISESGPFGQVKSLSYAQRMYEQVASNAGCDFEDVACLKAVDANALLAAAEKVPQPATAFCKWGPVIDGTEFDANPLVMARRGDVNKVPMMMGSNKNEGTLFTPFPHDSTTKADFDAWLNVKFGGNLSDTVRTMYNVSRDYDGNYWAAMAEAIGEENFNCLVHDSALAIGAASGQPVYLYYWTHEYDKAAAQRPWMGAYHSSELPFVFDDPSGNLEDSEIGLARAIVSYWQNFAATGDPNSGPSAATGGVAPQPTWPRYDATTLQNIQLGLPECTVMRDLKGPICASWEPLYPQLFPGYYNQ